jgi:hypothetical protein
MTRFKELGRIQAAIRHRNEPDLRWAEDYCRMRVRTATLNSHKNYWKGIQWDVARALRELSVTEDHVSAHVWSSYHRSALARSDVCGCFYCLELFAPSAIEDWTDDGDTALCPKCGIDSVIGSSAGYPIDREFLGKMQGSNLGSKLTPDCYNIARHFQF